MEEPTINPLQDLKDIYKFVWDIDIPSPTVPEYIEHHEQCVMLMNLIKERMAKYED